MGLVAVAALKTGGEINLRVRRAAAFLFPALVLLTADSLAATRAIRPELLDNYRRAGFVCHPSAGCGVSIRHLGDGGKRDERSALLCSGAYLVFMLVGAAAAVFPVLLRSTTDPALSITVYGAHSGDYALRVGLIWWSIGIAIASGYFVFVYRMFCGKATAGSGGHGIES
jgi:cytochrome bd ubiquinol oxidase subunit II